MCKGRDLAARTRLTYTRAMSSRSYSSVHAVCHVRRSMLPREMGDNCRECCGSVIRSRSMRLGDMTSGINSNDDGRFLMADYKPLESLYRAVSSWSGLFIPPTCLALAIGSDCPLSIIRPVPMSRSGSSLFIGNSGITKETRCHQRDHVYICKGDFPTFRLKLN